MENQIEKTLEKQLPQTQTVNGKTKYLFIPNKKRKDDEHYYIDLPPKFHFLIKDMDQTFRHYVDRSEIGERILASLEKKIGGVDGAGKPVDGFYMSSKDNEVGLISQLYGANAMFSLMNRYGVEMSDERKAHMIDTLHYVLDYLAMNNNCYDLSPILDDEINNELFVDGNNNYIGAMTWALSLFCQVRVSERRGLIEISPEDHKQIFKHIRAIIKFFVNNVIGTADKPLGWGYANGCEEPSLFFTYSVVEAFADFDDNVLNVPELGPDEELIHYIDTSDTGSDPYTKSYTEICYKIGDRAWDIFKDVIKTDFFSDNFSENFKIVDKDDVLNSSRSSVLFNTMYVIFILFYSYTNKRHKDTDGEEIVNSMTLALQLIQNFYDELAAKGKDSIVDRHIIAFDQPHKKIKDFGRLLNEESIQASPLLPMLVKANNVIAYHILKFPQQKMQELFDMMLLSKMENENDWLWDKRRFDVLSTARYIESIADFFDYYDEFERNYADKSTTDKQRRDEIEAKLTPRLEKKLRQELEVEHKSAITDAENKIHEIYTIERALNQRIDQKVEAHAMGMINGAIEKIIKYNNTIATEKADVEITFTPVEKQFKQSIESLLMSYFADDIRIKAQSANEMSEQLLTESVASDMQKFMSAFVEFIAYNNAKLPDDKKLSLADMFKIITNKK